MQDPRLRKLAEVLVNYSTRVRAGDWVHIQAGRVGIPLVKEVVAFVLKAGGHPTVDLEADELSEVFLAHAGDEQLTWTSPLEMEVIRNANVSIFITAPENTQTLNAIDPDKQRVRRSAYREWMDIYTRRSASRELRWVMTNYPCQALAQQAGMSLEDYENFVFQATFCDQDDPGDHWQKIHNQQQRLVDWFSGKERIRIQGPNVDLNLSIAGRNFINSDGDQNMPSGEIYTSPVEDSAYGWVEFSYPAIYSGREVAGVRLEFKAGKVVNARAEKNEAFLFAMLDSDPGARYLGELGIGTNYGINRFTHDILFDEKIGGTFHLAIGVGFPEVGGTNESALHWDFISDARVDTCIWVDDELVYQDGEFLI